MSRPDAETLRQWLQRQLESPALRAELWALKDQTQFCARLVQQARAERLDITIADLEAQCMAARRWWMDARQWH